MAHDDDEVLGAFTGFATELADGDKWKLARTDGWDDFQERLAVVVGELPVRRRQALMMLLFSLIEEIVTPEAVAAWLADHDVEDDGAIEELIAWLRDRRQGSGR
ncbi:MAG TPA: hypothetical protein VFP61_03955 [Acidimicrobiales bacterium]|nr:hypothetical protein [Acidimicrobiales bacterium]